MRTNPNLLRKDFPKVRRYVKSGNTYFAVDLRRKHYVGPKWKNFTDKQAALGYAKAVAEKVAQTGLQSISIVPGTDPKIAEWLTLLAPYGRTVEDAIEAAIKVFEKEKEIRESPYMAELLSVWLDDKKTGLKKLRPRTLQSLSAMANKFQKDFGMTRIKEIDQNRIEKYLGSMAVDDQTRENRRNYLSQFFNWSVKKGYFDKNPADKIEIEVVRGSPGFFTVEQCQAMMRLAMTEEHNDLCAYMAIGLFSGIRPEEISRLTWEKNIKMESREIFIQASIAKTKKDRIFQMSENLFAWLDWCKALGKPLAPEKERQRGAGDTSFNTIQNKRSKMWERLGFDFIPDGLRHSFCSYHYAQDKNLETLRHIMGNSPGIIERFYRGAIPRMEVEKFWSIGPQTL
jgi:integrase